MTNTVQIKSKGFEVTVGGRVTRFTQIAKAFEFAQRRLARAQTLRELSARCE